MADRVVVLGASGMLGTDLVAELDRRSLFSLPDQARIKDASARPSAAAPDRTRPVAFVQAFDLPELDITDPGLLRAAVRGADVIVNCAAYTNVDLAESEPERAHRVNAAAVGQLGELAATSDQWVLHISTDFVFDGTLHRPYCETDPPNPLSVYGRTKLAGERELAASGCRHAILRVSWTYGRSGRNFVTKIVQRARETGRLRVVDDQVGAPTSTLELARVITDLLPARPSGLYHLTADGYVSRFDLAACIIERMGLQVDLAPCKTDDFPAPASRPRNSRLDCREIREKLGVAMEAWRAPLARYLEQL